MPLSNLLFSLLSFLFLSLTSSLLSSFHPFYSLSNTVYDAINCTPCLLEFLISNFLKTNDDVLAVGVSSELYDILLHISHDCTPLSLITHVNDLQNQLQTKETGRQGLNELDEVNGCVQIWTGVQER